jgi:hypothetical protein
LFEKIFLRSYQMKSKTVYEKKEIIKHICLSESDLERIKMRIKTSKMNNFSLYSRNMMLNGYIIVTDDSKQLKELTLKINELSEKITALSHKDQTQETLSKEEFDKIRELMNNIWQSQRSLISETLYRTR